MSASKEQTVSIIRMLSWVVPLGIITAGALVYGLWDHDFKTVLAGALVLFGVSDHFVLKMLAQRMEDDA